MSFKSLNSLFPKPLSLMIPSGVQLVDQEWCGLKKERLIQLQAKPGLGKTTFALSLGLSIAEHGSGVAYISLEIMAAELTERIQRKFDVPESAQMNCPIYVWDKVSNFQNITQELIKLHNLNPIEVIFIDYLELLDIKSQNATSLFRNLIEKIGCSIIVLCQNQCVDLNDYDEYWKILRNESFLSLVLRDYAAEKLVISSMSLEQSRQQVTLRKNSAYEETF